MASIYYQGHGSYRIKAKDGTVIYVDPYAGDGYQLPADLILVTHQHADHNQVHLCAQKPGCRIVTEADAIKDGVHQKMQFGEIAVEAVQAYNKNHDATQCVGYLIQVDSVCIYASGDTSTTEQMKTLPQRRIDYALLPCDGIYNMDLKESADCARLIQAKHNIPIHLKPGELFDRGRAEQWDAPDRLIIEPGLELELTPS